MNTFLKRVGVDASAATVLAMAWVSTVMADLGGPMPNLPGTAPPGTGESGVRDAIISILNAVLNFLALVAVVIVVIAGIRLIISQGDEGEKDKAKTAIIYALVGLIIVLFARVIVALVTSYLASKVGA